MIDCRYFWIFFLNTNLLSLHGTENPEEIEKRIEVLENELWNDQRLEMEKEVKGQGLMIADWEKFAKEMQEIQELEEKDKKIEMELKQLKEKRDQYSKDEEIFNAEKQNNEKEIRN